MLPNQVSRPIYVTIVQEENSMEEILKKYIKGS